jgi:hypothetical protein
LEGKRQEDQRNGKTCEAKRAPDDQISQSLKPFQAMALMRAHPGYPGAALEA